MAGCQMSFLQDRFFLKDISWFSSGIATAAVIARLSKDRIQFSDTRLSEELELVVFFGNNRLSC